MTATEQKRQQRDRSLQLSWLIARELVGLKGALTQITELLTDLRTLSQQQTDLLRRLAQRNPRP